MSLHQFHFTPWTAAPQIIDAIWFSFITKLAPVSTVRYPNGNYLVSWAGGLEPKENISALRGYTLCRSITLKPTIYKDRVRVILYSKKRTEITKLAEPKWFVTPPEPNKEGFANQYYIVYSNNLLDFLELVKSVDNSAEVNVKRETFYNPSQQEEMQYLSQQATERSFLLYNYIIGLTDTLSPYF